MAGLLAAGLIPTAGRAQTEEQSSQTFVCQSGKMCRLRCTGLADVSRVERVVAKKAPWDPETLLLTVTYQSGVATLLLRGNTVCRLDNLTAATADEATEG